VIFANAAWTKITGYEQHEVAGQTFKILQGPMTNENAIKEMMATVKNTSYGHCEVVNYTKSGTPYLANIKVQPVLAKTNSQEHYISHYFGIITVSQISEKESNSMIFSLVNAEEYGWLVKTVGDLNSDKSDGSDQLSSSNHSDEAREKKNRKKQRATYTSDDKGGSDTSSQNAAHRGSETGRTSNTDGSVVSGQGATSGEGKSDQFSSRDNSVSGSKSDGSKSDGSKSPHGSDSGGKTCSSGSCSDRERTSSDDGGSDEGGGSGSPSEVSATKGAQKVSGLEVKPLTTRPGIKRRADGNRETRRQDASPPRKRPTRSSLRITTTT
jgi:PAS domain S-box-containing protein